MSLPTQITVDNFIQEFANLLTGDYGDLNTIYKIVFRCGNDVSSYNLPPQLNPLRSQCSTTTNLVNFLLTDGKYIPQISGYITDNRDLIKFNDTIDTLSDTNMVNITFNVNGSFEDDGRPYFPGHIFNILINKNTNSFKLLQSFLYNYTVRDYIYSENSIRDVIYKYYDIFIRPLGMKFLNRDNGYDLMKLWKDITDTEEYGYPSRPNILGECRPKFMSYTLKYQSDNDYFKTYMNNIVRLLNLFYQKILYISQNVDNISKSLGRPIPNTIEQFNSLKSLLLSKYSSYLTKCIFNKGIHRYYLAKGFTMFDHILILIENNEDENEKTIINNFCSKSQPILQIKYNDIDETEQGRNNYINNAINTMPIGKYLLVKNNSSKEYKFINRLDTNIFFLEVVYTNGVNITKIDREQKTLLEILLYVNNTQNIFYF
jgi:hypothetical protein